MARGYPLAARDGAFLPREADFLVRAGAALVPFAIGSPPILNQGL